MSQQDPGGGRGAKSQRRPHHISSIAHLFFAEEVTDTPGTGTGSVDLGVICFNDSRISAYASAGLVAGSRSVQVGAGARGVRLEEDGAVSWSAASYLPPDDGRQPRNPHGGYTRDWSAAGATRGPVRWVHFGGSQDQDLIGLEQLSGLAATAPTGWGKPGDRPGRHGLVVCLLACEVALWSTAFRLGRWLGLLMPRRLEVLVFPDGWSRGPVGVGRQTGRGPIASPAFLERCHELTRAVAGTCPVTITALPADDEAALAAILQNVAGRLTADFSVDPRS